MGKKILLIVEGDSDEKKFFNCLFNKCNKNGEYNIYSYKTNIHILAQELYNNYKDFDNGDTEIKLILSSLEKDVHKKKILMDKYSDTFMVFDFEPQHDHTHFDTIKRMIEYYNDSTNQGKLFINYPMMQSYKHFNKLPSDQFENLEISIDKLKEYKELVGNISSYKDLNKYDYITYYSLTIHHLRKANKIVYNVYDLLGKEEYLKLNMLKIYEYQINLLNEKRRVSVLNTCIFALIDFAPTKFFNFVEKNKNILLI
ncbi:uncharacterized protein BN756_00930 [Coprobacillus sp. CAG:698]|nr:uncharacterized protein BN756_00930 [Coprobacillus sp. CAG:698]